MEYLQETIILVMFIDSNLFLSCWAEYICHLNMERGWKVRVRLRTGVLQQSELVRGSDVITYYLVLIG